MLKGFLVLAETDFRKTHDLSVLGDLVVSGFPELRSLLMAMEAWTTWAVAFRYPSENLPEPEPDSDELRDALELIAQLHAALRALAPPDKSAP